MFNFKYFSILCLLMMNTRFASGGWTWRFAMRDELPRLTEECRADLKKIAEQKPLSEKIKEMEREMDERRKLHSFQQPVLDDVLKKLKANEDKAFAIGVYLRRRNRESIDYVTGGNYLAILRNSAPSIERYVALGLLKEGLKGTSERYREKDPGGVYPKFLALDVEISELVGRIVPSEPPTAEGLE